MSEPATLDPAAAGDAASSNMIAQFFEGLTALDVERVPQPALADDWAPATTATPSTSACATTSRSRTARR